MVRGSTQRMGTSERRGLVASSVDRPPIRPAFAKEWLTVDVPSLGITELTS
jgi:hypothetical protein